MGVQDTASAPATVAVGTSVVQVLADLPGYRRAFAIQNVHASNIAYLGFGPSANTVTTANGLRLGPGETYTDNEPECYSGAVYAIASAAGTDLRVVEF